jgi:molybdopterin molybdotransferase
MPAKKEPTPVLPTKSALKSPLIGQIVGHAVAHEVKLVDDCFATSHPSMTHGEALAIFRQRIVGVAGSERLALGALGGRILAEPITAQFPVPAHTNSAVDGYAFASAAYDRAAGGTFPIVGRATAGHALTERVGHGGAARIFTGAVMPPDLDTVAMQEDCNANKNTVRIPGGLKPGANVRKAGEDVAAGTVLFQPGHVVRPQDLAALASIGCADALCYRKLRVALAAWRHLLALKPMISGFCPTISM